MANREVLKCWQIGTVELKIDDTNSVTVTIVVANNKLLRCDLILDIDIIRKLDEIQMTSAVKTIFSQQMLLICVTIEIDEQDFNAELNKDTNI